MTDSDCAERLNMLMHGSTNFPAHMQLLGVGTSKHLIRQQTFPPLQPYVRARYMSSTADLGTCPEALLESRSSSSDSPDNENSNIMCKKDVFKREMSEGPAEKACKLAKLSLGQKENLDPSMNRKGSVNRRRGSAPVTVQLPTKAGDPDVAMSYVIKNSDSKVRRGSVPAEMLTLSNDVFIKKRHMQFYINKLFTGARDFVGQPERSGGGTYAVISSTTSSHQRRGSVPCEHSSNVLIRTSVNGKRRNPKKILRRRSSSGAEILTPIMTDALESSSGSAATSSTAWYRFKKDWTRRGDTDVLLTKRRGSLPVEVLSAAGFGKKS